MYLTVSSDSSKQFYENNTVACFTTRLTQSICRDTSLRYEVGVVEIFLPLMRFDATRSNIFLYSDISRPVMVADTAARLLRVISPHSVMGHHEFNTVHYVPVDKYNFDTITLSFNSRDGEKYDFPAGAHASIVVLHFRQASK